MEAPFALLHLVPHGVNRGFAEEGISVNYTTLLNILFAAIGLRLYILYARNGGPNMMQEMENGHCAHQLH